MEQIQLIRYYTDLLNSMENNKWLIGICSYIDHIDHLEWSYEESVQLLNHFKSIPRPSDASKTSAWYWHYSNLTRRIKFIKEIINNLQDELNLQTNDKGKINRTL